MLSWFFDSKAILVMAVWALIGIILALKSLARMKGKTIAYVTIIAFVLIIFAIIGTSVFCDTQHDFGKLEANNVEAVE